jgi:hypothetical protein
VVPGKMRRCILICFYTCSRQFYQGRLHDGVTAEQKPAAAGLTWPQPGQPVMFIAVEGQEEKAQRNKGKVRRQSSQLGG